MIMNPRTLLLTLGALLMMSFTAKGPQAGSAEYFDLMGAADTAIADGNWTRAEECLLKAIGLQPDNPSNVLILSNLGIVQYNLGRDSLAIATLNNAHAKAPRSVAVLNNRAGVFLAMGRDSLANADYATIASLDSSAIEARYLNAILSMRLGELSTAQRRCDELLLIAPEVDETLIANASLLSATEKWQDALSYYNKIITRDSSPHFLAARAVCYLMLGRLNEASADINTGLQADPNNKELYIYRAHLNKMRFQHDDALRDLRRALNLPPDK